VEPLRDSLYEITQVKVSKTNFKSRLCKIFLVALEGKGKAC